MIVKSYEIQKSLLSYLKYNLFLLYGENDGLKKDIKELIKTSLSKNSEVLEFQSLYENDIISNHEDFYNSIYSGSLFANKKLITIHSGTDKLIKQLEDIINKFPENIYLIIIADTLEKKSKLRNFFEKNPKSLCIPCYLDNDKDLEIIAKKELDKNNIILSKELVSLLVDKSNKDRNNLKNEIEKIKSYCLNKKKLEHDEIIHIINFSGEYKSDVFINECLCGNALQYKKILSELYKSTINQIFLLRILSNKIHRLLILKKQKKDHDSIDSLLGNSRPPIFWQEKPFVRRQLIIWNLSDLKKIILEINDVELLCKKNPQISNAIFFNFFTKLCSKANSYS